MKTEQPTRAEVEGGVQEFLDALRDFSGWRASGLPGQAIPEAIKLRAAIISEFFGGKPTIEELLQLGSAPVLEPPAGPQRGLHRLRGLRRIDVPHV
jgi:hypothetical protein